MDNKGKRKAPQEQNSQNAKSVRLVIRSAKTAQKPLSNSATFDISSRSTGGLGDKRRQPSLLKVSNDPSNSSTKSRRANKRPLEADCLSPFGVRRSSNIRDKCPVPRLPIGSTQAEHSSRLFGLKQYPKYWQKFNFPVHTPEDHEFTRKRFTIQLVDSLTRATAEANLFARELMERQDTNEIKDKENYRSIYSIDKQLEEALNPIRELVFFETQYGQLSDTIKQELELLKTHAARLQDYCSSVLNKCIFSRIHYEDKYKQLQALYKAQEGKSKPTNVSNRAKKLKISERNEKPAMETHSPPKLRGLALAVEAARAANPDFTL